MKEFNICIVGGGSTYTLGFLKSFVRLREEFPLKKLVLFDIDAQRQAPIGKYGEILFRERFPELEFSYTTDINEAYTGMDFVFMQMRAGGLDMRAKDEHIPLSMGMIGQKTCGAGGMAYGLRSCVDMIKAVHDIRRLAPDAWILNYSNPAAKEIAAFAGFIGYYTFLVASAAMINSGFVDFSALRIANILGVETMDMGAVAGIVVGLITASLHNKYHKITFPVALSFYGGKRFVRCDSLDEDYTEAAIMERISGKWIVVPKTTAEPSTKPNLLIDIQAKLQQAHSPGFERWASVFNLKEMAKTMNFLQEHGLLAYADLESARDAAVQRRRRGS